MKNKKIIIAVVILIVIVIGAVVYGGNDKTASTDKVRVGVILPLSGQYAAFGESVKKSMEMSLQDLPNKNVELVFEDDQFDSKKALSAYNKLQSVDNVDMVVGLASPSLEVLKPLVNQSNELLFTVGNEASIENDNVFEIIPWGAKLFTKLGEEVSGKYKKIGIVTASDVSLFQVNKDLFLRGLKNQDYVEISVSSNSDIKTEVSKMLNQGVDSYTVFTTTDQGVKLISEVTKQSGNKKVQVICDGNMELTIGEYFKRGLTDKDFEGCISTMIADTTSKEYTAKYKQLYNAEPNFLGVYGYDSVQVISKYLAGKNKNDWKNILEDKKFGYMGASGNIKFDETGSRVLESATHIFKGGKFVNI